MKETYRIRIADLNPSNGRDNYVQRVREMHGEKAEMKFSHTNNRFIALTLYENLVLIGGGALLSLGALKSLESFFN